MSCMCGRAWTHCHYCGSKNVYRLQYASMDAGVDVWKCKKCMRPSSDDTPCEAANNRELGNFVSKAKAEAELSKLPILDRLSKMVSDGASVEELKAAAESSGLKVEENIELESPIPQKEEGLPEGWSRNSEGKIEAPVTLEELFARSKSRTEGKED